MRIDRSCCLHYIRHIPRQKHTINQGDQFGRLTVLQCLRRQESPTGITRPMYECRCSCGNVKYLRCHHLTGGKVVSCGCLKDEKARDRSIHKVAPGDVFGWLTVVSEVPITKGARLPRRVICRCKCGVEKDFLVFLLFHGTSKSCGCRRESVSREKATTHGMTKTPTHRAWAEMLKRVRGQTSPERYKDRGITCCESWFKFENFLADMGEKPSTRCSLDRIDNSGNYEPSNCRWATDIEQANNKRNNRILSYRGNTYTMAELCRLSGQPYARLQMRITSGWSVEDAAEKPKGARA